MDFIILYFCMSLISKVIIKYSINRHRHTRVNCTEVYYRSKSSDDTVSRSITFCVTVKTVTLVSLVIELLYLNYPYC